jgi:hypothetical protein
VYHGYNPYAIRKTKYCKISILKQKGQEGEGGERIGRREIGKGRVRRGWAGGR